VVLTAPDGNSFVLHDKAGGNAHNIITTYDVSNTPALAALQGAPSQGDWQLSVSDHWRIDIGQLRRWSLEIEVEAINIVKEETAPRLAIPDNDAGGITSTLDIQQPGTIREVKAWVEITHTWIGDLQVELVSPSSSPCTIARAAIRMI
jgi:subtilisin-like proprotein convertase family protein